MLLAICQMCQKLFTHVCIKSTSGSNCSINNSMNTINAIYDFENLCEKKKITFTLRRTCSENVTHFLTATQLLEAIISAQLLSAQH